VQLLLLLGRSQLPSVSRLRCSRSQSHLNRDAVSDSTLLRQLLPGTNVTCCVKLSVISCTVKSSLVINIRFHFTAVCYLFNFGDDKTAYTHLKRNAVKAFFSALLNFEFLARNSITHHSYNVSVLLG